MTSQLQYQSKNASDINTCDIQWNSIICWAIIIIIYMIISIKTKLFAASSKRNSCHIFKNHNKNSKFKQQLCILEKASQIFKWKSPIRVYQILRNTNAFVYSCEYHHKKFHTTLVDIIVFYWDYEAHRHNTQ